jgi:hypothetical protein
MSGLFTEDMEARRGGGTAGTWPEASKEGGLRGGKGGSLGRLLSLLWFARASVLDRDRNGLVLLGGTGGADDDGGLISGWVGGF